MIQIHPPTSTCNENYHPASHPAGSHHDSNPAYDLFVRAFRYNDSVAFERLLGMYSGLVIHWAKQHPLFGAVQAERDKIAHYTFIKMWRSTRGDRFTFESLPLIMAYLRDCVGAALSEIFRDFGTKQRLPPMSLAECQDASDTKSSSGEPSDFERLWERIGALLPEPGLQRLVWYSVVNGYKPEALIRDFPDEYPDRKGIRVLKQKAMRRLRKDPALRRWYGVP